MREKRLQRKMQSQGNRPDLLPVNSPSKDEPLYGSPPVDMSGIKECIQKIRARNAQAISQSGEYNFNRYQGCLKYSNAK